MLLYAKQTAASVLEGDYFTGKAFSQRYFSIVFLLEKEGYVVLLSTILMQKGRMEAIMAWPGQEQVLAKKPALSPYRNHLHR